MYNKLLLYTAVLRPILTYGSPVWGYAADSNIKTLEVAQNSIIRNILRSPIWDIRSSELDAKRPYREVPYCIDTYWNSGKLRGRVSLMRSGIYRAHKEYEASM
ncbi:hypothetical protein TNCV_231521 [Trichonephila clavipes]|nr:hypothetical protein TNCV_231521 [Trichonephila clavipes]